VPGLYFFLGGKTPGSTEVFPHHTPDFFIDEGGLLLGVKTFVQLTYDYLGN
jgi:amidohydrolase